jgi:hypothetical protein
MRKENFLVASAGVATALATATSIPALATCILTTAGITKGASLVINKLEANYKK